MRRTVALVSAGITAFSLVVLISVVYAYRGLAAGPSSAALSAGPSVKTVEVASADAPQSAPAGVQPALAQAPNVSAQAAAVIASQYLHRTELASAEMSSYNGVAAFKITFGSGDTVYVSMTGQVLGFVPAPTYATTTTFGHGGHGYSGPGGGGGNGHDDSGEHDGGDGGGSGE